MNPPRDNPGTERHPATNWWHRAAAALLLLALLLPLLSAWSGWPRDVPLAGVEKPAPRPALTWRSWFDGSWARSVEPWLTRRLGLRGVAVRSANQLNYSLFGRTPGSAGTPIMVGRDHWLYETEYVRHYTRRFDMRAEDAAGFVADLAAVRRGLARRGIAFVLLISPSKAEVYPEHLPAGMREAAAAARAAARTNAYERLLPMLRAEGIAVADMQERFLAWKREGVPLFPPGGTHWNHYGAQRALGALCAAARSQPAGAALAMPPAIVGRQWRPPAGTDADLRNLLNLWRFEPRGPAAVPFPLLAPAPRARSGRILLVGDSFAFTLVDALARAGICEEAELLYYFKRRYSYDWRRGQTTDDDEVVHWRHDRGAIEREVVDWGALLDETSLVVLEINAIQLRHAGWGFPAALAGELARGSGGA